MFDWDRMEEWRAASVASARMAALGLPKEHLVPGGLVTISPCKCTGDRSFSGDIWEILAANEGHLFIKKHKAREKDHFAGPHVVCIHEHEFYGADHLVATKAETATVA